MEANIWSQSAAAIALLGLIAYALLGGADFGGGVLDLLAAGPRKRAQREAIARAMGPVWEANHVWLIFMLVVLFTCFPRGYAPIATALFVPFHLALAGIMLRGASFVFRGFRTSNRAQVTPAPHEAGQRESPIEPKGPAQADEPLAAWGVVFGVASVISPLLLGASFGALTEGDLRFTEPGHGELHYPTAWLSPYPVACGLLALSACTYLASVYLLAETTGELREDFRRRAIFAGTATAALAGIVLVLAAINAEWFARQLLSVRSWPVLAAGLLMFGLSAWAVFTRKFRAARIFAAGQVLLLLLGWGFAHYPYLAYPDLTLANSAGPVTTTRFIVLAVPVGMIVLLPSLWLLFAVFKGSRG